MELVNEVVDFNRNVTNAFAIAFIASGLLTCFFGYRLLRIVLGVTGFVAVGALTWTLLTGTAYGQAVAIIGAVLGAMLGAVAMFYVGVFLFGCALGLLIAMLVLGVTASELNLVVSGAFALVGGLVTLLLRKVLIVMSTGLTGAWSVVSGAAHFVEGFDLVRLLAEPSLLRSEGGLYYLFLAFWASLGIGGIAVQLGTFRKRKWRSR